MHRREEGRIIDNTQISPPSNSFQALTQHSFQHQTYRVLNVNDQVRITAWTYDQITAAHNYWEREKTDDNEVIHPINSYGMSQ